MMGVHAFDVDSHPDYYTSLTRVHGSRLSDHSSADAAVTLGEYIASDDGAGTGEYRAWVARRRRGKMMFIIGCYLVSAGALLAWVTVVTAPDRDVWLFVDTTPPVATEVER